MSGSHTGDAWLLAPTPDDICENEIHEESDCRAEVSVPLSHSKSAGLIAQTPEQTQGRGQTGAPSMPLMLKPGKTGRVEKRGLRQERKMGREG